MSDNVNHPEHYQNIAGVEAIDILNDMVKDLPGKQAVMLWNSMKYLFRFQKKNGVEDLKKARNYLDYLIADIDATTEAAKNIMVNASEILWDTWYSNEYGNMTIYSKSKKPNGMPSKLVFDTQDAAEEFQSVFYNMLSEGYDEFSITDAALEMKFRTTKGNEWNNWDEPINWEELHDSFIIESIRDKYELIFVYKSQAPKETKTAYGPCVIYDSKISGKVEVYYSTNMCPGTCGTIAFTSEFLRDEFITEFLHMLDSNSYKLKAYSIREVLINANFVVPDGTDNFSVRLPWKKLFYKFKIRSLKDKYFLDFVYKKDAIDVLEDMQPTNDEHILYKSTVWGSADVYYSTDMPQGTCTKILFDDEGGRSTFAIKFFNYLSHRSHGFSIQDVLEDTKFLFPKEDNSLHFNMPWNDIFKGFHITDEGDKYALEFIIDSQGGK